MDSGVWWAIVYGVEELDITEQHTLSQTRNFTRKLVDSFLTK